MEKLKIGDFNTLEVARATDFGVYLAYEGGDVLLPKRYVTDEMTEGTEVEVFIYHDSEGRLVPVQETPLAKVGDFAALQVKDVAEFGAFLDMGLIKDLFVPTKEQHRPMKVGAIHVVKVMLDPQTERLMGVARIGAFLRKDTPDFEAGQAVELLVYEITDLGYMCLIDSEYAGMLYKNEVYRDITIGSKFTGYIKKVREDDKIDLSERPLGFEGLEGQELMIMEKLQQAKGGFLPFNDKSAPDAIRDTFEMSKKSFKKLIGVLYKQRLIEITEKGIRMMGQE